jgi:hypothetical protein
MPQPTLINACGICAAHTRAKRWRTPGLGPQPPLQPTQVLLRQELVLPRTLDNGYIPTR